MRGLVGVCVAGVVIVCTVAQVRSGTVGLSVASGDTTLREDPGGWTLGQSDEVRLETPTGMIAGTLLIPAGGEPFPVVLLIAGSGPTDRDGNTVGSKGKSDCLRLLAEGLARDGIASLRYDKRAVARSAAARAAINSFDIQAEDAAGWVAWLRRSPRFGPVGIVGHSEGALLGTIAAQRGGVRAFVSLAGAGHPADETLLRQTGVAVRAGQLSQRALVAMQGVLTELRAGRSVQARPRDIPVELWTVLFQPRAQEYLVSWIRFDPVVEIAKLPSMGVSVLVVQGTTDLTSGGDDPTRLATAVHGTPVLIAGMNHELKPAPADPDANDRASADPRIPLAPGLLEQLAPFLKNALRQE